MFVTSMRPIMTSLLIHRYGNEFLGTLVGSRANFGYIDTLSVLLILIKLSKSYAKHSTLLVELRGFESLSQAPLPRKRGSQLSSPWLRS